MKEAAKDLGEKIEEYSESTKKLADTITAEEYSKRIDEFNKKYGMNAERAARAFNFYDTKPQDITITKENDLGTTRVTIDQSKTFVFPKDIEADITGPSIFQDITHEMYKLYIAKNTDYGSSVNDTYNKYGMVSYLVRMEDKLNRARTLVQKGEQNVSDEKLRDTLVDLANYAILAVMELDGEK